MSASLREGMRRALPGWVYAVALLGACSAAEPKPGGPCAITKDCVTGEICVGGACQPQLEAPSCDGDEDCQLDERCDPLVGECVSLAAPNDGGAPADAARDGGRRDLGVDTGVRDSGPFDSGFVTDFGIVDPDAANGDGTILDGTPIDTGFDSGVLPDVGFPDSGSILALGVDCATNLDCVSNLCLPLTIGMASRSVCASACGASSQCPINFSCTDVSGMSFCLGEDLSTPPATYDTASGGACSTSVNTCQSTWCNTGSSVCIETCSRSSDCAAFGGTCWMYTQPGAPTTYDHICYPGGGPNIAGVVCSLDANCQSGICNRYNSTCAAQCCSDADCLPIQTCGTYDLDATNLVKICVTRSPAAGTGALGAACTTLADCESEVCIQTDLANPASAKKCSTHCCRDADCSALPAGGRCLPIPGTLPNTIIGACQPN